MNLRRRSLPWIVAALAPLAAAAITLDAGCGTPTAPDPFGHDAGSDAGSDAADDAIAPDDAGPDADTTLGGPCLDNAQCNDQIDCTFDRCDTTIGRCRFEPDDSKCQNGVYCDGVERCVNGHGCVAGVPVSCDDRSACTIDTCVESTQSCTHVPRDADGDGDPDIHCPGGHDCDDNDPTVNSLVPEICANHKDDNCNGMTDEMQCTSPMHDTCLDPLTISASGTYALDTTGASFDDPTTCGLGNTPNAHDVIAAVILPAGAPVDVEVTAHTTSAAVAVAIAGQCGDPSTELACGAAFTAAQGGQLAKARGRALGSTTQMTAYPIYVATAPGGPVALDVQILPATPKATNETCGTAEPITPGVPEDAEILDAAQDLTSTCTPKPAMSPMPMPMPTLGELVYTFTLAAVADVDVYATSIDGDGSPIVSLRDAGCALPADEITCQSSAAPHLFRHSLPAGTYYVAVSATAPTNVELTVDVSAPTATPADETCIGSPVITPNTTIPVTLSNHQDDISLGCLAGAVDAAYELDLAHASDVLLVERIAIGDTGALGIAPPACTEASALLCKSGGPSPLRATKRNVPAGNYRVVVESALAEDVQLTAFVRDAVPPTLVPFADGCSDAFPIPPTGGFFQGNTANANADFPAGCDQAGLPANGAPDQLLTLTLTKTQRVILDTEGSGYNTIVDVRKGPGCPGDEIPNACTIGTGAPRSYLDLTLDAGVYYVQIDGFNLEEGPWFLDVRVVDP